MTRPTERRQPLKMYKGASEWGIIRAGLMGSLSIGGRKHTRWVAGERASVLIHEATYVELRDRGVSVTPNGRRRRAVNQILDDGEGMLMNLPEPADGAITMVGAVMFSTPHIKMLRDMGHSVVYRSSWHLRSAPIGGSFALSVEADAEFLKDLHGWGPCECCGGKGVVRK